MLSTVLMVIVEARRTYTLVMVMSVIIELPLMWVRGVSKALLPPSRAITIHVLLHCLVWIGWGRPTTIIVGHGGRRHSIPHLRVWRVGLLHMHWLLWTPKMLLRLHLLHVRTRWINALMPHLMGKVRIWMLHHP